jgi:hypothetical protein
MAITARQRATSAIPMMLKPYYSLSNLCVLLCFAQSGDMVCSALLDSKDGRAAPASMEASVRDIDDVETKDDGGCTVSYVLQRNLVSPRCLSIPILQKKNLTTNILDIVQ